MACPGIMHTGMMHTVRSTGRMSGVLATCQRLSCAGNHEVSYLRTNKGAKHIAFLPVPMETPGASRDWSANRIAACESDSLVNATSCTILAPVSVNADAPKNSEEFRQKKRLLNAYCWTLIKERLLPLMRWYTEFSSVDYGLCLPLRTCQQRY